MIMKELSIEEKAKAYDIALDKIKRLLGTGSNCSREDLEYVFPELAESEDERIRKEMIFYFTEEIPQCSIQEHSDKMREFISWLKKQEVERTKLELKAGSSYFCYKSRWERADNETFKKGLIYKCNKDGVLDNFVIKNPEQHFIEIKDERIAWLEKQGEQSKKHDVCDTCDEKDSCISPCCVKLVEEQGEQKSNPVLDIKIPFGAKDSELQEASYHIPEGFNAEIEGNRVVIKRGEQKPNWGEKDNIFFKAIIRDIENIQYISEDAKRVRITWLKSIRHQNTWKPSDEQIVALDGICSYIRNKADWEISQDTIYELYSLSEQLKKLRDEK